MNNILEIRNLSVEYFRDKQTLRAVRDVSLSVKQGETLAIVGESGCGKSTLAFSLLNLIFPHEGKISAGEIWYHDRDLLRNRPDEWQALRGSEISIIFQDPFSALNPVLTIEEQLQETIAYHNPAMSQLQRRERIIHVLHEVMLSDDQRILASYPHQLSGGQLQRVAMALALVNKSKIIIADEPTTALDVTTQKEILDLIDTLKKEYALTVLLITHNLSLAYERSQKVAVMYAGEIVETGNARDIFANPLHPYTQGLMRSIPKLNDPSSLRHSLAGQPPNLAHLPNGCKFWPRCDKVMDICKNENPEQRPVKDTTVRCFLYPT